MSLVACRDHGPSIPNLSADSVSLFAEPASDDKLWFMWHAMEANAKLDNIQGTWHHTAF